MSSPATAAFLAAWRKDVRRPALLCTIEFSEPTALTLHLSDTEFYTPDGQLWDAAILSAEPIRAPGDILSPGPDMVSGRLDITNRKLSQYTTGSGFAELLSDYQIYNATVTLKLWLRDAGLAITDALQVFKGVANRFECSQDAVTLYLLQDRAWNRKVPTTTVNRTDWPSAPDESVGVPVPVIYGNFRSPSMRTPWALLDYIGYFEKCGHQGLMVPFVVVNRGTGTDNVQAICSAHALRGHISFGTTSGRPLFVDAGGPFKSLALDTGVTTITPTVGGVLYSGVDIADDSLTAYFPVVPIDVSVGANNNTATNPRDSFNLDETNSALLDGSGTNKKLEAQLPNLSPLGNILAVYIIAGYKTSAAATGVICKQQIIGGGASGGSVALTASTTPAVAWGAADADFLEDPLGWNFGMPSTHTHSGQQVDLVVSCPTATETASIYFMALCVKFKPSRALIHPAYADVTNMNLPGRIKEIFGRTSDIAVKTMLGTNYPFGDIFLGALKKMGVVPVPSVYELQTPFHGNIEGYADDVSGTYTGTASALIQRTPDILRHLLVTYGAENATTSFETGASAFGSFVLCRTTQLTEDATDFIHSCHIGRQEELSAHLRKLCGDALVQLWLDRFDDKWRIRPWLIADAVDYDLMFSKGDILADADLKPLFRVESTSDTAIVNAVKVRYGFEPSTGKFLYDSFVNDTVASSGAPDTSGTSHVDNVAIADESVDVYGHKTEQLVSAETLRDYHSANDLRDRMLAFMAVARIRVVFSTSRCPDLQRGRIIGFDSSLDAVMACPKRGSEGTWAGLSFRVLEVTQNLGPLWHNEVVAVEVTDTGWNFSWDENWGT